MGAPTSNSPSRIVTTRADQQVEAPIAGAVLRDLVRHPDPRGGFTETFRQEWIDGPAMLQGNRSDSHAGVIRGLHFHRQQADYWVCTRGRLVACLHDLRRTSPTRGTTWMVELPGDSSRSLYIPPGIAHGFGAIEESTLTYLVDRTYDPRDEFGIRYDDPVVGADWASWGIEEPILSNRDHEAPLVADLASDLP